MERSILACVIGAALSLAACGRSEPPASTEAPAAPQVTTWNAVPEPLAVPAAGQSAQPQLTASERGVLLSWLEHRDATATLKFAERPSARGSAARSAQATSSDDAAAARQAGGWSPARTISASDNWFVSWADVPTVMRLSDGTLVATTNPATDPLIEAYDLRITYSTDEGQTWTQPIAPHHDGTTTQHGFASLFELPDRRLGVVWLDGRDHELNTTDPDGGAMGLYYTSFDRSWHQGPETSVNMRVCECCQTSAVVTDEGPVVAFRDRTPREIRDINVARLEDGAWTPERPVHVDGWRIEACPVNGPALSARGRSIAAAWFAAPRNEGHAFAAFSSDAGRTWSDPIRLDDEVSLGHVDIEMLDDGSAVASWVEFTNQRAQLRVRHVQPSGMRSTPVVIAGTGEGYLSGYPRLARNGDELVLAWTETSSDGITSQQVKAAVVPVPRSR